MKNIRVGIVDDHSLFREGLRMIMADMQGISVTLDVSSGEELLELLSKPDASTHSPDVILLDIEMKTLSGIDTLKKMPAPRPKVIMLSMHTEPRMISYLMSLGANGYLQKDVTKEELEIAIRTSYEKGNYFNEQISQSLLSGLINKSKKPALTIKLSAREKEVLTLICQELTTAEIGEKLFISERTVEGHRKNLCEKLGARNTAGLVKKAMQLNLIEIP